MSKNVIYHFFFTQFLDLDFKLMIKFPQMQINMEKKFRLFLKGMLQRNIQRSLYDDSFNSNEPYWMQNRGGSVKRRGGTTANACFVLDSVVLHFSPATVWIGGAIAYDLVLFFLRLNRRTNTGTWKSMYTMHNNKNSEHTVQFILCRPITN